MVLPETGVCGGAGVFEEPTTASDDSGCCAAPAPQLVQLGAHPDQDGDAAGSGGSC
jgi:hypothetical protein